MKEVKSYIRVFKVDDVIHALEEIGAPRLTAIDVRALGHEVDEEAFHVSMEYGATYTTMVKIEVICADSEVSRIVDTIRQVAHTGRKGDGVIAVSEVGRLVGIRTGKEDEEAL
ncbi:MAG: P-II family nitrogen regulator [Candidatus Latescibacteria bacterium]|nr:P-II family nitrogen regulator [Candidatus Latescibacterota bacterium]MCK5328041.1 P-II family nitrogen regulator [Candidatus Latescibacterota bacterium]